MNYLAGAFANGLIGKWVKFMNPHNENYPDVIRVAATRPVQDDWEFLAEWTLPTDKVGQWASVSTIFQVADTQDGLEVNT